MRNFTDLVAWQLANELRGRAIEVSERPRVAANRRFRDQLADAASSAPRNIAEGYARFRPREFAQFVRIAKASECEVLDLFFEARQRSYINDREFRDDEFLARRAIGAATGLIRYLENCADPRQGRTSARDATEEKTRADEPET